MAEEDSRALERIAGRRKTRFLPAVIALSYAVLAGLYFPVTVDDAYITARYAENVASGQGAVFNRGERVEGYSSPLCLALMAVPASVGLAPVPFIKALGLLSGLGILLLLYSVCDRLGMDPWLQALVLAAFGLNPSVILYSVSGLETLLFALLCTAAIFDLGFCDPETRPGRAPALLLLAALTRPEGMLLLVAGVACIAAGWLRRVRKGAAAPLCALFALALAGAFEGARWAYYGNLLPNTFWAKPGALHRLATEGLHPIRILWQVASGQYFWQCLAGFGGIIVLILAVVPVFEKNPGWGNLSVPVCTAALVSFPIYAGSDWMTGCRFCVPFLPSLFLLAGRGLQGMDATAAFNNARVRFVAPVRLVSILLLVFVFVSGVLNAARRLPHFYKVDPFIMNPAMNAKQHRQVGRWLADNACPGSLLVCHEIGAIGYFSGLRIIDIEGLIQHDMARFIYKEGSYTRVRYSPELATRAADIIAPKDPDLLLVKYQGPESEAGPAGVRSPHRMEVIHRVLSERFAGRMRFIRTFPVHSGYTFILYGRPGIVPCTASPTRR